MPIADAHRHRLLALVALAAAALVWGSLPGRADARRASAHATLLARCGHEHARRTRRECVRSARLRHQREERHRTRQRHRSVEVPPPPAPTVAAQPPTLQQAGEPCPNTELIPSESDLAAVRSATLCLINQQRVDNGEVALVENPRLAGAAQRHSEDMVSQDYFEHTSPSGEDLQQRIVASGYIPRGAAYELGENIDCATLSLATPAATVKGWMDSPEHRANILNGEFHETGIGISASAPAFFAEGEAGATYTQDFGILAS